MTETVDPGDVVTYYNEMWFYIFTRTDSETVYSVSVLLKQVYTGSDVDGHCQISADVGVQCQCFTDVGVHCR